MPNYTIPKTFIPGALPRITEYGKLKGVAAARDTIEIIPMDEWRDLFTHEDHSDLTQFVPFQLDQDSSGSCASEGSVGAMMCLRDANHQPFVLGNPWAQYYKASGGSDRGSSLDENIQLLMEDGMIPDSVWPRYDEDGRVVHSWQERPSNEAYAAAKNYRLLECSETSTSSNYIKEVGSGLWKGLPCYFGYPGHAIFGVRLLDENKVSAEEKFAANQIDEWIERKYTDTNMCRTIELVRDRCPEADQWYAKYKNSWGDWGVDGYGTIRLGSLSSSYGAFFPRVSSEPV